MRFFYVALTTLFFEVDDSTVMTASWWRNPNATFALVVVEILARYIP